MTFPFLRMFPIVLLFQTRLLFSIGASGITTMLSATLNILVAARSVNRNMHEDDDDFFRAPGPSSNDFDEEARNDDEQDVSSPDQPLLGWRRRPPTVQQDQHANHKPAALPALLGISAGIGALLAVFGYLRIPTLVSGRANHTSFSLLTTTSIIHSQQETRGLRIAFYIVAAIAVLNAVIAFIALPKNIQEAEGHPHTFWGYIKHEVSRILVGFKFAKANARFRLACAGGFAARAQTISVS